MSKITLKIISIVLILMGIAGLIPTWTWSAGSEWYSVIKIVLGVIGFAVAYSER